MKIANCRRAATVELLEHRTHLTSVVVNTTADGIFSGAMSLRNAILIANSSSTPTKITFSRTVFRTAKTITLNGIELDLSNTAKATTITGPSAGVTISANNLSRDLKVDTNVVAQISHVNFTNGVGGIDNLGTLTLSNSTISRNNSSTDAAGLRTFGTATLTNVTVTGNVSTSPGAGGIGGAGSLTLLDVTVSNNQAVACAGIHFTGAMSLTNVTVVGNSAVNGVGGIAIEKTVEAVVLTNVTVVGNSAGSIAGGLYCNSSSVLANTVVAGNNANISSPDVWGSVTSLGHNFIGEIDGSSGWVTSDITGTIAQPVVPKLDQLTNNGGPTQTMLPMAGSPLIDHGSNALIPRGVTTDQRGLPRIVNGTVDIGAVEQSSDHRSPSASIAPGGIVGMTILGQVISSPYILQPATNWSLAPLSSRSYGYSGSSFIGYDGGAGNFTYVRTGPSDATLSLATPINARAVVGPILLGLHFNTKSSGTYSILNSAGATVENGTFEAGRSLRGACDLAVTAALKKPSIALRPSATSQMVVTVSNYGTAIASGTLTFTISSSDAAIGSAPEQLLAKVENKVKIGIGAKKKFTIKFVLPFASGQYIISTSINDDGEIFEIDHGNDIITMPLHVS